MKNMNVGILVFDEFESLDAFGPAEIFGRLKEQYKVTFYSQAGGSVRNSHGVEIITQILGNNIKDLEIFLIPGGYGTRKEVDNRRLIDLIRQVSESARYTLTVCTGSALLAKTGLLDGKKATSNKRAFSWAITCGPDVQWIKKARWTIDGKYYTSSGVSAGMDMTLGFLSDLHGEAFAREVARQIEFDWQENKDDDKFCDL